MASQCLGSDIFPKLLDFGVIVCFSVKKERTSKMMNEHSSLFSFTKMFIIPKVVILHFYQRGERKKSRYPYFSCLLFPSLLINLY